MPKLQENAWIIDQENVAHQTYRMRLESPGIASQAKPGQFVMLQVRDGSEPLLRRPFSFHRIVPQEGRIEILYRVAGRGTWLLSQCAPGTRLSLVGPLGNHFELPRELRPGPVFLVAGGIGIAPLGELMLWLSENRSALATGGVHLFYGARTSAELLASERLAVPGVSIHWSTDDGTFGFHGYVTQLLQRFAEGEGGKPSILYACGPLVMQYHVARWALAQGIPAQLSLESLMACGLGACLGCALPSPHRSGSAEDHYVHVCKDGPIFSAGTIQWQKIQMHQVAPPIFLCV